LKTRHGILDILKLLRHSKRPDNTQFSAPDANCKLKARTQKHKKITGVYLYRLKTAKITHIDRQYTRGYVMLLN